MCVKANADIRNRIQAAGLYYWQLAEAIGIHESTVFRWMRTALTDDRREKILAAIDKLSNTREE